MKRILLTLLAIVLVFGLFAAVGYTGYRFGYSQGVQATAGESLRPGLRLFDDFGQRGSRGHDFGFGRGSGGFPLIRFGFLPLLGLLAVLTLAILFAYWLFTRSGWRLARTTPVAETPPPPAETEVKE